MKLVSRTLSFAKKWLWCFWAHRDHRCYPTVWGEADAEAMGIPYRPDAWHCRKCHPCNEGFPWSEK